VIYWNEVSVAEWNGSGWDPGPEDIEPVDNEPDYGDLTPPPRYEPRCHVCKHPQKKAIERLAVIPRMSMTELGAMFAVDRRSITNHMEQHLDYENLAIRRIIEHEAKELQVDVEQGVQGALSRRIFLSVFLQKTTEALMNGDLELTGKDAMKAIEMMDKIDSQSGGAAIDEIRMQFNAFIQAFREITQHEFDQLSGPQDLMHFILRRTEELLKRGAAQKELEEGS
jgi:hypothetical protein